jgi:hypothetical protein
MRNFKKVSIAAAVTTALGAIGTAQALTLGEPGEALLVPYAQCVPGGTDSQRNTLVGITIPTSLGSDPNPTIPQSGAVPDNGGFATAPHTSAYFGGAGRPQIVPGGEAIHWYFFDEDSFPVIDDGLPATPGDYVPFDWCGIINKLGAGDTVNNMPGYLVFTNDPNVRTGAGFAMYGDAAIVDGNWQSAAFIPVVPMADNVVDSGGIEACENEVMQGPSFPSDVNPLCAAMPLDNDNGVQDSAVFNMRYFVDQTTGHDLQGQTEFVLWFDSEKSSSEEPGRKVHVEVWDTDENHISATLSAPKELNVIDPVAEKIPGMHHGNAGDGVLYDQGYVEMVFREAEPTSAGHVHSAVAFSLIHIGTSANPEQVQTSLAQERGIW